MAIKQVRHSLFYAGAMVLLVLSFFPMYWLFVTSIKPVRELYTTPPSWVTFHPVWDHYLEVFRQPFLKYYTNSLIVACYTLALCLVLGSMMAYALSRLQFRGKRAVMMLVISTSMFPPMTMVLPIFTGLRGLDLLNTYTGLSLTHAAFGLPAVIWLLSALFNEIPKELEEAAMSDGANRLVAFVRIMLPLSAPALATAAILTFVNSWNEFLFAFTLMSQPSLRTLPVGVMMFPGEYEFPWATISAAILLSVIPLLAAVFLFQNRLIQGLTNGAVKG